MIQIYNYINYREYLKAYFAERKKMKPSFSFRYLSRRVGLSSSNFIMLVMQGKRNLTQSLTFKLADEFKLSEKETGYFESMIGFIQAKSNKEKDRHFGRMIALRRNSNALKLEESQYDYYSNWYNLVIRELVTYKDFRGDFSWLARKIVPPITPGQAKRSVQLLLRLGLIQKKGDNFIRTSAILSTGPEISSLAVVNFHRDMARHAAAALDSVKKEERNMTACTVNISDKGYREIVNEISECRKKILSIAEADSPAQRVYHMNFQLFPVSQKINY